MVHMQPQVCPFCCEKNWLRKELLGSQCLSRQQKPSLSWIVHPCHKILWSPLKGFISLKRNTSTFSWSGQSMPCKTNKNKKIFWHICKSILIECCMLFSQTMSNHVKSHSPTRSNQWAWVLKVISVFSWLHHLSSAPIVLLSTLSQGQACLYWQHPNQSNFGEGSFCSVPQEQLSSSRMAHHDGTGPKGARNCRIN